SRWRARPPARQRLGARSLGRQRAGGVIGRTPPQRLPHRRAARRAGLARARRPDPPRLRPIPDALSLAPPDQIPVAKPDGAAGLTARCRATAQVRSRTMLPTRSLACAMSRLAASPTDERTRTPRPPHLHTGIAQRLCEGAAPIREPGRGARALALALALSLGALPPAQPRTIHAQTRLTTPEEEFGHPIGAHYQLPNYQQLMAYWQKLAVQSDRMVLDTIGFTAEGRPQLMAIITSPENHRNLERYKEISRRLALAEGLTDEEARALAREGKAVVWIDGGLHATEVLGAQQLMELVWQLVSMDDPETLRILDD